MHQLLRHLGSALSELRRRRIFHVVAFYGVAAWLAVQITNIAVPALHLPAWTLTLVFFLALLGFPVVAILAWAYDLTPEGLERTDGGAEGRRGDGAPGERPAGGGLLGDPTDAAGALRRLGRTAGAGRDPGASVGAEREPVVSDALNPSSARAAGLVLAGGLLLMTAGLGWLGWQVWLQPPPAEIRAAETVPELDPTRVAVLYFDDHSEAGDLGHLAHGLTEALIHELTQVPALDVVSRFGVKPFRGASVTVDSIVRVLKAGSLVEGSVQRSGDRLRVTVQLVDGATNSHLESETLERPFGELFALQDSLVLRVADILRRTLGTELRLRTRRAETESVEAWSALHQAEALREDAEQLVAQGEREAAERELDRVDYLFAAAEALDPAWLEPILLRGWTAADRAALSRPAPDSHDPAWYRMGLEHAERALRLRPEDARARELRGTLRFRLSQTRGAEDSEMLRSGAEADLRAALGADPALARAWAELAELLRLDRRDRRLGEARWAAERALQVDAFLSDADVVFRRLYQTSLELEDFNEAIRWCEHGRQRFPDDRTFVACRLHPLALPGGPEPDVERAWQLFGELLARAEPAGLAWARTAGQLWVAGTLARAAERAFTEESAQRGSVAISGDVLGDSARAVARRARTESIPETMEAWADYYEANVHLLLGEREEALRLVERFLDAVPERRAYVTDDWMLRALWEDPRFQALSAR